MAFCEQCGTPIPDGYTRCANCGPVQEQQQSFDASVDTPADAPKKASKSPLGFIFRLNPIGLTAQFFYFLIICGVNVLKRWNIWEIAIDYSGAYFIVAFALFLSIGAYVFGNIFNQKKISNIATLVQLVAFLLIWFPFSSDWGYIPSFTVGFYIWFIGLFLLHIPSDIVLSILGKKIK